MKREKPDNKIVVYQDENGVTKVSVRFSDEDLWLTQNQIAEIYDTTQPNISMHIDGILADGELSAKATHQKFLLVQTEGRRQVKREINHYNLDMVIAIGYRVQSQVATRFRQWATQRLHDYIQKGFAMDDERLKQGGARYSGNCSSGSATSAPRSATSISRSRTSMPPPPTMIRART